MENVKILIVDDEILIAEDLKDILGSLGFKNIGLAHSKSSAITMLQTLKPHLALLDIRMENEFDGLEIGEHINSTAKIPFIYITAHSDVAMIKKIVKTMPSAYITKPFKKSDLLANISLALESVNKVSRKNKLMVKDGYNTVLIDIDEINYIESEGNYLNIYCDKKRLVSRQSFDNILKDLDNDRFFKVHRSYIVNLDKVTKFSTKDLMIGEIVLPISRNCIDEFDAKMKKES